MRNFKIQMQEIFAILDKQKEDLKKKEMQTLEQSIKQASKEKEFRTLSFNSVIARPPFIMAPRKKDYFDPKLPQTFIDTGKVLDYSDKEALIFPSRIKEKNISNSCFFNNRENFYKYNNSIYQLHGKLFSS